ncbi:MAG TPA: hypothetical protein VIC59_00455 [Gemmatimonadota bacterium]
MADPSASGSSPARPEPPLPPRRILVVHLLLVAIVGGQLWSTLADRERWPFSPYAMYSTLERERTLTWLRLYGVPEREPASEIPLLSDDQLAPFDQARLPAALGHMAGRRGDLREALRDCLERYETLRRSGRHDGPPLRGVRLYRVRWTLDPEARNVDRPDRRTLVLEVLSSSIRKRP